MPILRNLKSKGNGLVFKNIFKKAEEKFAANDGARRLEKQGFKNISLCYDAPKYKC